VVPLGACPPALFYVMTWGLSLSMLRARKAKPVMTKQLLIALGLVSVAATSVGCAERATVRVREPVVTETVAVPAVPVVKEKVVVAPAPPPAVVVATPAVTEKVVVARPAVVEKVVVKKPVVQETVVVH
jgi:hypothetical protein